MPKKSKSALFRPRSWWKQQKKKDRRNVTNVNNKELIPQPSPASSKSRDESTGARPLTSSSLTAGLDTTTSETEALSETRIAGSTTDVDSSDVTQQIQHESDPSGSDRCILTAPIHCHNQAFSHDHCYGTGSVSKQVIDLDHCYFRERSDVQSDSNETFQDDGTSGAIGSSVALSVELSPPNEFPDNNQHVPMEFFEMEVPSTPALMEEVQLHSIEVAQDEADEAVPPGDIIHHESTFHGATMVPGHIQVPIENPQDVVFSELQQSIPKQWAVTRQDDGINLSQFSPDKARVVQRSICVAFTGDFVVFAHGHELPRHHIVYQGVHLEELSQVNVSVFVSEVLNLVCKVRLLEICTGASNSKFKVWWKNSLENCVIDSNTFHESRYTETLRSKKCEYLINQRRRHCNSCNQVLVRFANRKLPSKSPLRKTPNKHKPLKFCTSEEKAAKSRRATKRIRNLQKQNTRLREKLYGVIEDEGVEVDDELGLDLQQILERNKKSEKNDNGASRFQKIFIEQQIEASKRKNMRGMKWHPLMIRFALQLKMCGGASLKMSRSFIRLPSDRLLFDYTHYYDVKEGCQLQFINETAEKVSKRKHDYQKFHVLSFDEVSISQSLVQKKSTGEVVGYCHLNEVQTELLDLKKKLEDEAKEISVQAVKSPPITKKMLTYMIKGTASSIRTCVASYSVDSLTKEELYQHTWEVIGNLETSGICVIACVFDGSPINRGFVKMHPPVTITESGVVFDTPNPYEKDRPLFFIPDPPHNLKTTRNALENSGRKKSRCMKKNGEPLTWKPIVALYKWKSEQTVKKLHKLTSECVNLNSYSRMRVNYAARVLSNSVASQLQLLKWANTNELSIFINYQ